MSDEALQKQTRKAERKARLMTKLANRTFSKIPASSTGWR